MWAADLEDDTSAPPPVPASQEPSASTESCQNVYRRALEAFSRLEGSYFGEDIILVSHEDTLSIFCASLYGTDLRRHHLDYPFALGQVRASFCLAADLPGPPRGGGVLCSCSALRRIRRRRCSGQCVRSPEPRRAVGAGRPRTNADATHSVL